MNILILSNNELVEWQGAGYVILNTSRALNRLGHTTEIMAPSHFSFLPGFKSKAVNHRMAIGMALWTLKHRKKILRYDLIIFYTAESSLALFTIQKLLRINIPAILHSNGLEVHADYILEKHLHGAKKWYHFNKSWLFNYCYKNTNAIITTSKFEKDFAVSQLNIPASKVFVLEPCLPDIFFKLDCSSVTKKNIITFCGTWIPRKGIKALQSSIPDILRKYTEYSFRIIGTGNNFDVKDQFPPDIVDRIELYPMVAEKEQLIQLYTESSIFLFPSLYESFGLVIVEAMFCKCAVISGSTGIAADLINNEEAIILEPANSANIYNSVESLITNGALREKLGNRAKKRTENLNWDNFSKNLNKVLQNILEP